MHAGKIDVSLNVGWPAIKLLVTAALASLLISAHAQQVTQTPTPGAFALVANGKATPLIVSADDWPGVQRVTAGLAGDVHRVTGLSPSIGHTSPHGDAILIGTIGRSALIDGLIRSRKLDVHDVAGKWESAVTTIVEHPLPGVARALVIAGSDKRGTIFAAYDLSERIGVSPWYWWADVPIPHHDQLFLAPGRTILAEPAVKYRGIFLNDEAPALSGWAHEKFGGFNSKFYAHVFELLLRLKANYLWPAMWGSAFNEDDPENPRLADEYGIVMGTSHHEPMLRAQQEWKRHGTGPWDYATNHAVLDDFWRKGIVRNGRYESTITLGMRGDGDEPMTEGENIKLLERIVADQRKILAENMTPQIAHEPKVWALYKEVQAYYEKGMRVPDDVTLLWCDDNWGNIRRLPTPDERKRPGGAGIYYHFDYVGDPRSYKWLNTTNLTKVQEQMHLAWRYGADRIWIVNVGDLKPMEFPISFLLAMAREPAKWDKDHVAQFGVQWAAQQFGPQHAADIAAMLDDYTRLNQRRKPEQLEPSTYSLANFHEADRVDAEWRALEQRVDALAAVLPVEQRAAFFELVQYPADASATVNEMYIAAARNAAAAKLGNPLANAYAAETRRLFSRDTALSAQYNHQLDGRWNHMMDQTHIGYTFWNEPPANAMPPVTELQTTSVPPLPAPYTAPPPPPFNPAGAFQETNGYLAIEAAHTATRTGTTSHWEELPGFGEGLSAMSLYPVDTPSQPDSGTSLQYRIATIHQGPYTLELRLAPTQNFVPGRGLRLAVSLDEGPRTSVDILQHNTPQDWAKAVSDGVKTITLPIAIPTPGPHTLQIWAIDPGIVLERLTLSQTPIPPTYLGPPESPKLP